MTMSDNQKQDLAAVIHDAIDVYRDRGRVEIDVDIDLIIGTVEELISDAVAEAREAVIEELSS